MIFFTIFYEFFLTGLFMYGGGLASIPFLTQMAETTDWFTLEELMNMIAISESSPGPIAVNIATYAGFKAAGIPGSVIATISLLLPSVIITSIVARLLTHFRENALVNATLYGLRPASLGLIAAAGLSVLLYALFDIPLFQYSGILFDLFDIRSLILAIALFVLIKKFKTHPVLFLAGSAIIGIIIY
ncbi:MAG: chromate transporter [Oscillospiraceae bacterium]|nr:chromate transporter [Oscillospiraceae bacterium]